jgi:hypothetical protein
VPRTCRQEDQTGCKRKREAKVLEGFHEKPKLPPGKDGRQGAILVFDPTLLCFGVRKYESGAAVIVVKYAKGSSGLLAWATRRAPHGRQPDTQRAAKKGTAGGRERIQREVEPAMVSRAC